MRLKDTGCDIIPAFLQMVRYLRRDSGQDLGNDIRDNDIIVRSGLLLNRLLFRYISDTVLKFSRVNHNFLQILRYRRQNIFIQIRSEYILSTAL